MDPWVAFALGVLAVATLAVPLAWFRRRRAAEGDRTRRLLESQAEKGRELLAAAPDGLYTWDHGGGEERCSRRLAVLLDLAEGTGSRFDAVLARFEGAAAVALGAAVDGLRRDGTAFEMVLPMAGGRRSIHAIGVRAGSGDGRPLADTVWMRDVTDTSFVAAPTGAKTAGDARVLLAALDAAPLPVWLRDGAGEPVFANRASAGLAVAPHARALAARAKSENRTASERHRVVLEGTERVVEIIETPLPGESRTIGFAVDLSAGDGEAEDLRRRLDAQSGALETLTTAIAVYGPDTRLAFFNAAFADMGRLDRHWLSAGPTLGEVLERLREVRRLPEVAEFRAFKDDQLRLFETLSGPVEALLHLPDGTSLRSTVSPHLPGGLVFTYEDVTDRLALERSFKTLSAVQRETLDNLQEGVAVFGSDGRLRLNNPAFARLWKLAEGELGADTHVADFIEGTRSLLVGVEDWASQKERIVARLMSRQSGSGRLLRGDGSVLEYANVPLPDGAVLLSYLDVSDGARVEMALRQRAEALADADRLKSGFIANVSYEVRTPLTSIIGFAEILSGEHFGTLNPRQLEYSRHILGSAQTLMTVISDILDLAAIEAGIMALERDKMDLHGALVGVLALIRERARRKALRVEFDCPPDIGWMVADEKRLKQVVFNLLGNAVSFTAPQGRIRLAARRDEDHVVIEVADDGAGIPQADQERVFHVFEHCPAPEGDPGGAGLGLSLVRRFVELHGGRVDLRSAPGKGTTVTCVLPAAGTGGPENDRSR